MTLANRITLARLVLVPVLAALILAYRPEMPWIRVSALMVFLIAALSDALDGFVARAYDQKTKLGAILDPLADKLLINVAFIFLAANDQFKTQVPAWLPVIFVGRDGIITIGAYLVNEYFGPVRVRPRILGKLNTVLQMSSIVAVLLDLSFSYPLLMTTLVVSVISFADYMYIGSRQVGNEDRT